jgi:hypothetical protein
MIVQKRRKHRLGACHKTGYTQGASFCLDRPMHPFPPYVKQTPFRRFEKWVDHASGWLLWPSLWWVRNQEKGVSVRFHAVTLGWGQRRWRWTWGLHGNIQAGRLPRWDEVDGDAFIAWGKAALGGDWSRSQVQRFFRKNPRWLELVMMGGLDNHYLRLLMGRELMRQRSRDTRLDDLADLPPPATP